MKNILFRRIILSIVGVSVCAFAVGIFKIAALGVDPFQGLMTGLNQLFPISYGLLYIIVNAVLLIFSLVFNRSLIGIGTFVNMFLLGYITEFSYGLMQKLFVNPNIFVRIACMIIGILIICIGSGFYFAGNLGVSTYDAIAITIADKWHVGKFKFVRIITDLVCLAIGIACFFMGGGTFAGLTNIIGVGTIITALCMGPTIDFFRKKFAKIFLGQEYEN